MSNKIKIQQYLLNFNISKQHVSHCHEARTPVPAAQHEVSGSWISVPIVLAPKNLECKSSVVLKKSFFFYIK